MALLCGKCEMYIEGVKLSFNIDTGDAMNFYDRDINHMF